MIGNIIPIPICWNEIPTRVCRIEIPGHLACEASALPLSYIPTNYDIFKYGARLAEWSKAWDLSSHNRKIAWVRTPHLANDVLPALFNRALNFRCFNNWLQWRNRLAHGTYRQYIEKCRGCEFEPHLEQNDFIEVMSVSKFFESTMTGLEPAIPRSEVWCLIH